MAIHSVTSNGGSAIGSVVTTENQDAYATTTSGRIVGRYNHVEHKTYERGGELVGDGNLLESVLWAEATKRGIN